MNDAWEVTQLKPIQLTHWGRVMQICISKQTIIGSYNGLLPGQHQAIIWTNAGILLIGTLATSFSAILSKIYTYSIKKMHLKMASAKLWHLENITQANDKKQIIYNKDRQSKWDL